MQNRKPRPTISAKCRLINITCQDNEWSVWVIGTAIWVSASLQAARYGLYDHPAEFRHRPRHSEFKEIHNGEGVFGINPEPTADLCCKIPNITGPEGRHFHPVKPITHATPPAQRGCP